MAEFNIDFLEVTKAIAKKKGLLMKDVAKNMGISYVALSHSLNNKPNISTLEKIATAIGCDPLEFFRTNEKDEFLAIILYKGVPFKFDTIDQAIRQLRIWRDGFNLDGND